MHKLTLITNEEKALNKTKEIWCVNASTVSLRYYKTLLLHCPWLNNDRLYLLQVTSRHIAMCSKSSFRIPRSSFDCKQHVQKSTSTAAPLSVLLNLSPLMFLYYFSPVSFIWSQCFFCFGFLFFPLPLSLHLFSWPLRLTTTCITLHYNSSIICWAERKTTHTCCSLSLSCSFCISPSLPYSLAFFSL